MKTSSSPRYTIRNVIHYRNLQQCTRRGFQVTKIHRILKFVQSPWLRDYIQLNTDFRTRANNDFEKNWYKLMNNAVFGKTMENHVDVQLLTSWDGRYGAEAMIAKPNFHSRSVFSKNLVAIEMRKLVNNFSTQSMYSYGKIPLRVSKSKFSTEFGKFTLHYP